MHPGVYTRVGAFTRAVGVYTQGVRKRTPSRIHRFLRIRTPDFTPTAYTQESTNRNVVYMQYRTVTRTLIIFIRTIHDTVHQFLCVHRLTLIHLLH